MDLRPVIFAVWLSTLLSSPASATEVRLGKIESGCSIVKLFERCELTVPVSGAIKNPFDPDEVALEATFTPATGRSVTVPGFYDQPFQRLTDGGRDVLQPFGEPVWKVRFTPRQVGRWTHTVKLTTRQGEQKVSGGPFLVIESEHAGFLQLDRPAGYLRFETGPTFMPIGENLCWGPSVQPLKVYDRWLRELTNQHANFIRLWMAPWGFRLETKETGAGRYDQARAWELDYLLEQSEVGGLYWQLCVLNHGSFSRSQDPDWQNNPYNESLGGMCRLPNDFLTDPRAKALFKRLLRYLVARWGYSPHLAVWELFNEADFGEFRSEDLATWMDQMSSALRAMDINQRPITTSFHKDMPPAVWNLPTMDIVQVHVYDARDFSNVFGHSVVSQLKQAFHKPVFIGEFGWIQDLVRKLDEPGIHLHDGLWSSAMSGAMGGALIWYWDTYVHPHHLERHFRALEAFWRGEQLVASQPLKLSLSDGDLAGWGFGTTQRAYFWIKNRTHTVDQYLAYRAELAKQRLIEQRGEIAQPVSYPPRIVRGATATIQGLDWLGRYRVEWWDSYRGRIVSRSMGRVEGGALTIEVPEVSFDLAGKLIKLEWWEKG